MQTRILRFALVALAGVLVITAAPRRRDKAEKTDIVDTAVAAGDFKTLVAAVKAADLVDTLKGKGPFTVFAPRCGVRETRQRQDCRVAKR